MEPNYAIFKTEQIILPGTSFKALVKVDLGVFTKPEDAMETLRKSQAYNDAFDYIILPIFKVER